MANEEQVTLLKAGVEGWNEWRKENRELRPNLRGGNLSGANLRGANLSDADLSGADLSDADLSSVDLNDANLSHANLSATILQGARFALTVVAFVDLSQTVGLETSIHYLRSPVSTDTLRKTADSLSKDRTNQGAVVAFLRGAGVPEEIIDAFRLMIANPIEFYSCFISYTHTDKAFARRMYDALQGKGIRCWLDEKELRPGDHILDSIDRGIRLWDKIIIVCSEASLGFSPWVERETGLAIEKETQLSKQEGKPVRVLIPLNLDGYLFSEYCTGGNVSVLKGRLAADFTNWEKDNAKFESEFEKVVEALRT